MRKLTIAIDGPASSGKSTVAKLLAKKYDWIYLDTGAMYRCVTLYCLRHHIALENEQLVSEQCTNIVIEFVVSNGQQHVLLNGEDVTTDIRQADVTANVSLVSSYAKVRSEMVLRQQSFISDGGIIMDGRDIGTVVMPNADLKVFMVASAHIRAKRRYEENIARGIPTSDLETLTLEIEARDLFDSTREVTPLVKAKDAVEIDTSEMSIDDVVHTISALIEEKV